MISKPVEWLGAWPAKENIVFVPGFSMTDLPIFCWSNRRLSEKGCHWPDMPNVLGGKDRL